MTFLTHLECARCGQHHDAHAIQNVCHACRAPLLARYDLDGIAGSVTKDDLSGRAASMWRYHEFLPLDRPDQAVTLGEGWTPILPLERLGRQLGLDHLTLKDEGLNPTGTFKARGAAAGVSRARELGVRDAAMPTAGNAGGAWAAYAARAGIGMHVVMPRDAPAINHLEVEAAGGELRTVDGLISDAGTVVAADVQERGWFDASTLKEPYRIEGKKTMGLEIAEQTGWHPPDVVLYPAGGGVGLIGVWKAVQELQAVGWLHRDQTPRLIAVQAAGCAPLVRAWAAGEEASRYFEGAQTLAAGLRVPKALGDFIVLRAVRETGGTCIAVEDAEILDALRRLGEAEGLLICPEGAACIAALPHLLDQGDISRDERVLALNTGAGLKYPDALRAATGSFTTESQRHRVIR
jgi:threonine synthase